MPRYRSKEPQIVRCLALLTAMAHAKRGVNLRQLAERRGWNWRAVYRDVEALRRAGVPVEHPEHGWYRLPRNWLPASTADIKPDELLALYVARCMAPGLKDTAFGRGLDGLWSKLANPSGQEALALGDETLIASRSVGAIDYSPHRIILDTVCEALRRRRALSIRYRKPDGAESERVIEPAFMCWEPSTEGLYVVAWCRLREQFRTFAIHRISRAAVTDEELAPRREGVAEMSKAYRLWSRPQVEHVKLRFSPRVAGEIRERRWHRTQQMTDTADGGVILEMDIAAPEELERLLLGYGADVVVEEPSRLAERIRERHAEALGAQRLPALSVRRARRGAFASKRVRAGRKVDVH